MGKLLAKAKPDLLCAFCGVRFPHHDPPEPDPLCGDCEAACGCDEAFFLAVRAGPDTAQLRRGLPQRRAIYRLRLLIKRSARDLGFHIRWGRLPRGLLTTDQLPDCPEDDR